MSSTAQRPALFGSGIRLHQETEFHDLLDFRLFPDEVSFGVATGHSEPSGQQQQWG
jgi:hypothetical protein